MPEDFDLEGIDSHLPLIEEFRQRFPLFERLVGHFGVERASERIPWFFGFILAVAANPAPGACCFVLEKTNGTTPIAAVLAALSRLKSDFPTLVAQYARHGFVKGQRVRVRPSDFVYEYEGVFAPYPDFFKLKRLGKNDYRSFRLADVLRLEPTDRLQPRGELNSDLGSFESSPLDQLLDLTSCGNNSIIRNTIVGVMPRAQFRGVTESVILAPRQASTFARLDDFLSWGAITANGTLRPNDPYQTSGEPLIAVSGTVEDVALACSHAASGQKIVFADGCRPIVRNLQAYDEISARQRLIIVAGPSESEDVELLGARGCAIWRMSPAELLLGETAPGNRPRASLVGGTIRAAKIRERTNIATVNCDDALIEHVAEFLEAASKSLEEHEQNPELDEAIGILFRALFESANACFAVPDDTSIAIETACAIIGRNARWLSSTSNQQIRNAVDGLKQLVREGAGQSKATALVDILTDRIIDRHESWAVISRSSRTAKCILAGLKDYGMAAPVRSIESVASGDEFDGLVLTGWPNDSRFRRLHDLALAAKIEILAYRFERKWIRRYNIRSELRASAETLSRETRAALLQVEPHKVIIPHIQAPQSKQPQNTEPEIADLPVFRLEDRLARRHSDPAAMASTESDEKRPATLTRFRGGCYAFLTEWRELPVLNEIIQGKDQKLSNIKAKSVEQLAVGDFVLFRAAGDKEFIRLIAEETLGRGEYEHQRLQAERWKSSLHRLGGTAAAIQRRLGDFGLVRTPQTVNSWLNNPNRIGPGDSSDIEVIAKASGDSELARNLESVSSAITIIRGAHLSAGMHLTKLLLGELRGRVDQVRDEPTLLDLGYGEAWVVQIESVEDHMVDCPSNRTNRLLWASAAEF